MRRDLLTPIVNRINKDVELLKERVTNQLNHLADKEGIYFDGDFFHGEGQIIENELTKPVSDSIELLSSLGIEIERNDDPDVWSLKFEAQI